MADGCKGTPHPTEVHAKSLGPMNGALFGKSVFANVIQDLKLRPSWIIHTGPKSNDTCPHKREAEKARVGEAGMGVMRPQAKPEEVKGASPGTLRGSKALETP